jgi:hypothetical protein
MLLGKGAEMKCEMEAFACDSLRKQRVELYNYNCVCSTTILSSTEGESNGQECSSTLGAIVCASVFAFFEGDVITSHSLEGVTKYAAIAFIYERAR